MKILNRLPYFIAPSRLTVAAEEVRIKPYQIIIWVSIGPPNVLQWHRKTPVLPAILDTGNNHNFSINERHLVRWAGVHPESLRLIAATREHGQRIPLRGADLWLHPNRYGKRERQSEAEPYRLTLAEGIVVYPESTEEPRLPLLGLRALTHNKLRAVIDGAMRHLTVTTPTRWWWPFS